MTIFPHFSKISHGIPWLFPRLDIQLSLFQSTDWGQPPPFGGFGGFNFGGAQLAPGEAGKAGDKRWGGENEVSGAERSIYPLWRMDNHGLSFLNLFFLFHFFLGWVCCGRGILRICGKFMAADVPTTSLCDIIMPSKIVQDRTQYLRGLRSGASERVRDIIQEVIDLYSDRKIANYSTAEKLIKDLKSENSRTVNGAIRRFEKKASQWRTNEELAERMRANTKKEYAITFRVYSKTDTGTGGDAFVDNYGIKYKMIIDERQVILKSCGKDLIPRNIINKYVVRDEYEKFIKFLKAKLQQKEISKREYDARATVENFKQENLLEGPPRKRFV